MKAICFMQEVKEGDLTIREQMLVCRRALRKLRWPCVLELFAQAGTEEQPCPSDRAWWSCCMPPPTEKRTSWSL